MLPATARHLDQRWIEAILRFHAMHIQVPNFAFKLTSYQGVVGFIVPEAYY